MNKKFLKAFLAAVMSISAMLTSLPVNIMANDNISESTTSTTYTNELPGFNGKDIEIVSDGYKLGNNDTNNLNLSTINTKEFVLEADLTYIDGQKKTSIVLGAGSSDYTQVGNGKTYSFFGLELFNDNGTIKMKMFQDGPNALGDNVIVYTNITTTADATVGVKVSYTNANGLEVWVDGVKASFNYNQDFLSKYNGGYVGLLSYASAVTYENIKLSVPNNSVYENVLPDYVGTQVSNLATGYKIGNNDTNNHSVSSVATKEFEFETIASYNSGDRFSLVLGADSNFNNVKGGKFFGLEFMVVNGNEIKTKLFRESPNKVYFSNISLGSITSNQDVRIKASLVNGTLKAKINDNDEVVLLTDTAINDLLNDYRNGGNIGFLTYKSEVDLEDIKVTTLGYTEYDNVLPGLNGANCTPLIKGYRLRSGGNNISISNVSAEEFVLETDITYESGRKATILLGAQNNVWDTIGRDKEYSMYGIEFDKNGTAMTLKMFQDGPVCTDNIANGSLTLNSDDNTISVKLSYTVENGFEIWIDNQKVEFNVTSNVVNGYVGGYMGFLTFQTQALFSNIKVVAEKEEAGNFVTNLENLTGMQGTWKVTADGLFSSGSGDNFAMSSTTASDFIFEADVTFGANDGAASLVFRSEDAPKSGSYVANILKKDKKVRLFKFPGGADVGTATLDTSKDTYHLRVEAIGDALRYYVDGDLLIADNDATFTSGKLGLLTYDSTVTYQNVKYTEVTEQTLPKLLGLTATGEGAGFTFAPAFAANTVSYDALLPAGITKMNVTATADTGTSLAYKIISANGVVSDQGTMTSGSATEITPPLGASKMMITLTKGEVSTSYLINITKKTNSEDMASEDYRPQVHFSPEINFMNDPNGLVYDTSNNTWHMFFQYSPQLHGMGSQTWGHAVSNDLVNWVELPVAIPMNERGAIYSGSAVSLTVEQAADVPFFTAQDIQNFKDGNGSLLVALYTTTHPQQDQSVAYSTDHGVTWTQHGEYAIKHDYTSDRDPKVFKMPAEYNDDRWYLIVAGGNARLYVSENLRDWTLAQDLTWQDGSLINSECPDMYPLAVIDRDGNSLNETKWVYNASSEWYVVGDMIKNTTTGYYEFKPVTGQLTEQTGGSSNAYAGQSYYNDPVSGRRITVHWMQDSSTTHGVDKRWNGAQSLPLETKLMKLADGSYSLIQTPVAEVEKLRGTMLYTNSNITVEEADVNILNGITSQVYEIVATFDMAQTTATEFGFELRKGDGEKIVYKYDANAKKMILDKSLTGNAYDAHSMSWTLEPTTNGKIELRVIVDQSVIEAFGNDGEAHLIDMCYPTPSAVGMSFYTKHGFAHIDDIKVYELKSIYTQKDVSDSAKETYITLTSDEYVEINTEFTVTAEVYPMTDLGDIEWTIPTGLAKVSETSNSVTLKGNTEGAYTISAKVKGTDVDTTVNLKTKEFNTNLVDWNATSGTWEVSYNGMLAANSGIGDSYYVSSAKLGTDVPWVYEADMMIESGQAGGLLFGVKNPTNPGSHWMCLNSDLGTNNNFFKFFKITGNNDFNFTTPHGELAGQNAYHFRLEYDGNGLFTFKVAPYGTTNYVVTNTKQDDAFAALSDELYFGLISYRGNVSFDNVYLTTGATITSIEEQTPIVVDEGTLLEDFEALLPTTVKGKGSDGNTYNVEIGLMNFDNVKLDTPGTYTVNASAAGIDFNITVIVEEVLDFETLGEVVDELMGLDPEDYTEASVDAVTEALEIIENLINDEDTTQAELDEATDRLKDAIDALVNIVSLDKVISEVASVDTSKYTEASAKAFINAYNAACKARVEGTAKEVEEAEKALADAYNALEEYETYKIVEGMNANWATGSGKDLVFKADGDFAKFVCVEIDDKVLDKKHYTAKAGSTIVTISEEYLSTLSVGEHKLSVVYRNGEASCTFTVSKVNAGSTGGSNTGDTTNVGGLLAMLIASMAILLGKRKRA